MATTSRGPGRIALHIDGLRARLVEEGYTPASIKVMVAVFGRLGRWMADADVEVAQLDDASIASFIGTFRGTQRVPGVRRFRPLLNYLDSQGALAPAVVPVTAVGQLLADYRGWLVTDRGLADPTVVRYENLARRFLGEFSAGGEVIREITPAGVVAFLLRESGRVSVGAAKGLVAELRSLLRFLYVRGLTPTALASAVPPVAGWHDTGIPVGLSAVDVQRLLDGCDSDAGGVRDLAMLLLVARLGLRSAEVARLELGDIDWRAGEIVVRGKGRRHDRLPLPSDVGRALATYLLDARPATSIRRVFLPLKAPIRSILPALVSQVCRRACQRVGLPAVGAHRLRHSLATEMLRRGAKLVEVSQVLRHRDLATTAIYAKVDLDALRRIAQPWPGAHR